MITGEQTTPVADVPPFIGLLMIVVLGMTCTGCRPERTAPLPTADEPESAIDAAVHTDSSSVAPPRDGDTAAQFTAGLPRESAANGTDAYRRQRATMVAKNLAGRDISNQRVLDVMSRIRRDQFVPEAERDRAYNDSPLPIGHGQTISQPYIVALMTQLVEPRPDAKALDIGTGSGYQAAVLAKLVKDVYSIEIVEPLAKQARSRLQTLGYENIQVRHGDGYRGWPERAPFDIIIVAAAPDHVPQPLVDQLAPGGKMVIPVGAYYQDLLVIEKTKDGKVFRRNVAPVAFVPMTGEAQK